MEILKFAESRLVRGVLIAGFGATALTACGDFGESAEILPNRQATVTGHEYHRPYTTLMIAGKVLIPISHPAEYHIDVQQCDRSGDEFADENGCVTVHTDVTRETYEQYADGDPIVFSE